MKSRFNKLSLLLLILSISVFSQDIKISVTPLAGGFSPVSDQISGYYDSSIILTYGGELTVLTDIYDLGLYFNLLRYKVNINDPLEIGSEYSEKSTITSLGLQKRFETGFCNIDLKGGISIHSDNLQLGNNETRIGFRGGVEASRNILGPLNVLLGAAYDYNKLSVTRYYTFAYSRHNSYLSGQELNTGGFIYYAGLSYTFSL